MRADPADAGLIRARTGAVGVANISDDADDAVRQVRHGDRLANQQSRKPSDGSLTWRDLCHDGEMTLLSDAPKEFREYRNHVGAYYMAHGWKVMGDSTDHVLLQLYTLDAQNKMRVLLVHPMFCMPGQQVTKQFVEAFAGIALGAHKNCESIPEFVALSAIIVTNEELSPEARAFANKCGIALKEHTTAYDLLKEVTPWMTQRERDFAAGSLNIPMPRKNSGCLSMVALFAVTLGLAAHFFFLL